MSQLQRHRAAGRIISMKISNDTIGNRTSDLTVCTAVPQPIAPPRTPFIIISRYRLLATVNLLLWHCYVTRCAKRGKTHPEYSRIWNVTDSSSKRERHAATWKRAAEPMARVHRMARGKIFLARGSFTAVPVFISLPDQRLHNLSNMCT